MNSFDYLQTYLDGKLEHYIATTFGDDPEMNHGARLTVEHMHEIFNNIKAIEPNQTIPKIGDEIGESTVVEVYAPLFFILAPTKQIVICRDQDNPSILQVSRSIWGSSPKSEAESFTMSTLLAAPYKKDYRVEVQQQGNKYYFLVSRNWVGDYRATEQKPTNLN